MFKVSYKSRQSRLQHNLKNYLLKLAIALFLVVVQSETTLKMAGKKLECSICMGSFKNPKLIPCQHSFCFTCLEDYVRGSLRNGLFVCPVCMKSAELPKKGVSGFPSGSTQKFPCDLCGLDDGACGRCLDCEENLCKTCCDYHEKSKASKHHKIYDLGNLEPDKKGTIRQRISCEEHPEEELKLVCKNCNVLICLMCKAIHHGDHTSASVADAAVEVKRSLEVELNRCADKLGLLSAAAGIGETFASKINKAEEDELKTIDEQHSKLITMLIIEVVKMKSSVKSVYEKLRSENIGFTMDAESKEEIISSAKEDAQKLFSNGTHVEIIRKGQDLIQRLSTIKLKTALNPPIRMEQHLFTPAEIKPRKLMSLIGTMNNSTKKINRKRKASVAAETPASMTEAKIKVEACTSSDCEHQY